MVAAEDRNLNVLKGVLTRQMKCHKEAALV